MVNSSKAELLISSIAVLYQPSDPLNPISIGGEQLASVLRQPLNIGQGPGVLVATSSRDQVEVQFAPTKIDVRELSGEIAQGVRKIPEILYKFLPILGQVKIQSYGINFILETDVEKPNWWLGDKLLDPRLSSTLGASPSCDVIVLGFEMPPKERKVRFEARLGDKLIVNFNASELTDALPNSSRLGEELREQYSALTELLAQLGL